MSQDTDQLVTPPVPGEDLEKEMKRAGTPFGKSTLGLAVAVVVAFSFGAGVWVDSLARQGSSTPAQSAAPQGRQGAGRGTTGTVERVEGATVYVKTQQGTEVAVSTSDQTTVSLSKPGALTDLTPGANVTVQGQPDSDGKVTARAITQQPG